MTPSRPFSIACALFAFLMSACTEAPDIQNATVDVMTFNIRYDNPSDGIDAWGNRSQWVGTLIDSSDAAIVGLQEALRHQIDQIVEIAPRFSWIGGGRDDGRDAGEFSPILYDSLQVQLLEWQQRWLSDRPDSVGSVGWDAALTRIATLATFKIIASGDTLHVVNAHFDHRGEIAREESARLLRQWSHASGIVIGDFNFEESSPAYQAITFDHLLNDAAHNFGAQQIGTFRTFDPLSDTSRRIDYIFYGKEIEVLSYDVLSPIRNGRYASDHMPVIAEIRLK